MTGNDGAVLRLEGVGVDRDGRAILDGVDLEVRAGQRWVVLGPNGSGKTTLVRVASCTDFPTRGRVEVLGHVLGRVDLRRLRPRIGLHSPALAAQVRPNVRAVDLVVAARSGSLVPWWSTPAPGDREDAMAELRRVGCEALAERPFGTLSSGEQQRVLLARVLVTDPALLLLDEPASALDLGGREHVIATLDALAADPTAPPVLLVTHHVEEIPAAFTHALLLREGRVQVAGPIDTTMSSANLSACFGLPLDVGRRQGRWTAFAAAPEGPTSTTSA